MEVNTNRTDDIKAEEEGEGVQGGLRVVKEAQSQTLSLLSSNWVWRDRQKCGHSHSKCRIFIRCFSSSGND